MNLGYEMVLGILVLAGLALPVTGCEAEPSAGAAVTDSAGVSIVLSAEEPRTFAELEQEPALSIGGPNASGPAQFNQIRNVHVDDRGRLWVADGGTAELRVFDADGSVLQVLGGRGEGPGEFRRLGLLGGFADDSVAVWDDALGRLTVYSGEGTLARTQRLESSDGRPIHGVDVFPEGAVLGQLSTLFSASTLEPGQLLGDSVHLVRLGTRFSMETPVATATGPTWLWTGETQIPVPFTTNAVFDLSGDRLFLAQGPEFRLRVFVAGGLEAIFGVSREPRPVSDSEIQAYEQFIREFFPDEEQEPFLSVLEHPRVPEKLPAYSQVMAGPEGRIWARIYAVDPLAASDWDVFDGSGEWLGRLRTPPGFVVLDITEDEVVGAWRDDFGVEYVRTYRFLAH